MRNNTNKKFKHDKEVQTTIQNEQPSELQLFSKRFYKEFPKNLYEKLTNC